MAEPPEVLLVDTAYERLGSRMEALGATALVLGADGVLRRGPNKTAVQQAEVRSAWLNLDVWRSPARDRFLQLLDAAQALGWVQTATAGVDAKVYQSLLERGVALTTSHSQSVGIADYVLWAALDHLQRGRERRTAQAQGQWRLLPFREMADTRWLLVGFGAIGQAVATRAKAFGAHVTGVRRSPGSHPLADAVITLERLHEALTLADVVVLCLPLDHKTHALADRRFFAAMKPGSVIINVARGALLDECALLEGLEEGRPSAAVLDVFSEEPLPPPSPLWSHPSITATAHTSWASGRLGERTDEEFLENLRRYVAGEPLLNRATQ